MDVTQLHTFVNAATESVLGETGVLQEDFSNLVDIGGALADVQGFDNYVGAIVNKVGKTIFNDRVYGGNAPSVLMDAWEFGSILEKIQADLPEAEENDTWELTGGNTYGQDEFYAPVVSSKFFNSRVTFEIPLSFTERQVKESFQSATQLNAFVSMLTTSVENSMTVKLDSLIMRTIVNMAAETINDGTTVRAVNLLGLYNGDDGGLEVAGALSDPDFIRYATYIVGLYTDRLASMSTLFNVGAKARFTPRDSQSIVLLSDFAKASDAFLRSRTENEGLVTLPAHDTVPYWQGSGTEYAFEDTSKIHAKTSSGPVIEQTGVLGVAFDRNALGVTNLDRRVTTHYNAKAEFYTNFYKFDAGYFNDLNENFIVFYIEDAPVD